MQDLSDFREMFDLDADDNPPALRPELQGCLYSTGRMNMIGHPYVHTIYTEMQNHLYNTMYEHKAAEEQRLVKERNWASLLHVIIERPYRVHYFGKYADMMTDKEYWSNLGDVWTDSENIWQNIEDWRAYLSSSRRYRPWMMDQEERDFHRNMPHEFEVWRGTTAPDGMGSGMSWSLSKERAEWFANRFTHLGPERLLHGVVRKEDAIAYFNGRGEQEIVALPESVTLCP